MWFLTHELSGHVPMRLLLCQSKFGRTSGTAPTASLAGKQRLEIGKPDVIRPSIAADRCVVAAVIIGAIDQGVRERQRRATLCCEGDLPRAGESGARAYQSASRSELQGAQSAASLFRFGWANNRNSARSPWYLASLRLVSRAPTTVLPDGSKTRHSHPDLPRFVTTTSNIRRLV